MCFFFFASFRLRSGCPLILLTEQCSNCGKKQTFKALFCCIIPSCRALMQNCERWERFRSRLSSTAHSTDQIHQTRKRPSGQALTRPQHITSKSLSVFSHLQGSSHPDSDSDLLCGCEPRTNVGGSAPPCQSEAISSLYLIFSLCWETSGSSTRRNLSVLSFKARRPSPVAEEHESEKPSSRPKATLTKAGAAPGQVSIYYLAPWIWGESHGETQQWGE